ncbi:hypothetical protein BWI93_19075 [Siphonobacter sp. BAB-5385]|uniref:hypothetical protein n=1 Tax=Siphonobacter sp. BAB-5385 TaxID=1864822 RepID=UPI000B9EB3D8|nr:hypothetical protein [Siphonobacter sp. BAB-5385]OZI06583.1 hypothetical protein BWI93_19075 [Siphonobacter sp. BAB-5385]
MKSEQYIEQSTGKSLVPFGWPQIIEDRIASLAVGRKDLGKWDPVLNLPALEQTLVETGDQLTCEVPGTGGVYSPVLDVIVFDGDRIYRSVDTINRESNSSIPADGSVSEEKTTFLPSRVKT